MQLIRNPSSSTVYMNAFLQNGAPTLSIARLTQYFTPGTLDLQYISLIFGRGKLATISMATRIDESWNTLLEPCNVNPL